MAINQFLLIDKAASYQERLYEGREKLASAGKVKSAFLSHSHDDATKVEGLIVLFEEKGIKLYVDWKDHTMPDTPNVETARRIQNRIKSCDLKLSYLAKVTEEKRRYLRKVTQA